MEAAVFDDDHTYVVGVSYGYNNSCHGFVPAWFHSFDTKRQEIEERRKDQENIAMAEYRLYKKAKIEVEPHPTERDWRRVDLWEKSIWWVRKTVPNYDDDSHNDFYFESFEAAHMFIKDAPHENRERYGDPVKINALFATADYDTCFLRCDQTHQLLAGGGRVPLEDIAKVESSARKQLENMEKLKKTLAAFQ